MKLSFICVVCLSLFAFACGSDGGADLVPLNLSGLIGGCHIENNNEDIRVGLMGQTRDGKLYEIISSDVKNDGLNSTFTFETSIEPPDTLEITQIGENEAVRYELQIFSYIDDNKNKGYDEAAGEKIVGVSKTKIYFFESDEDSLSAKYGYNLLKSSMYSQDFASENPYVLAGGCEK